MSEPLVPGAGLLRLARVATALFVVAQLAAVAVPRGVALAVAVAVSLLLFTAGIVIFTWGFLIAAGRSRDDAVTLSGLYLLQGTAPAAVRKLLLGALVVQVVVAVATAAARPFTPVAFGILVPLFGVALTGLWGARHGTFFTLAEGKAGAATRPAADPGAGSAGAPVAPDDEDPDDFDQLFKRRRRKPR